MAKKVKEFIVKLAYKRKSGDAKAIWNGEKLKKKDDDKKDDDDDEDDD